MGKGNLLITSAYIMEILKTDSHMDTANLIGKMDQFIEAILKMVLEKDKESILILKTQVSQGDFGKMVYSMEMESICSHQVKNIGVYGRIAR